MNEITETDERAKWTLLCDDRDTGDGAYALGLFDSEGLADVYLDESVIPQEILDFDLNAEACRKADGTWDYAYIFDKTNRWWNAQRIVPPDGEHLVKVNKAEWGIDVIVTVQKRVSVVVAADTVAEAIRIAKARAERDEVDPYEYSVESGVTSIIRIGGVE